MESNSQGLTLNISFKKETHQFQIRSDETLLQLKQTIYEKLRVPIASQKLTFKKKGNVEDNMTIQELGITSETKIMLIGTTESDIEQVKSVVIPSGQFESMFNLLANSFFKEKVMTTTKVYKTPVKKSRFARIEILLHYPNPDKAKEVLERIANDPGIIGIMDKYNWNVGLLKEMDPIAEHTKLGHNVNQGLEISLRLRFEEGFRAYHTIKDVMLHELTHMVWGDHDNSFYTLYRKLQKEVVELDWTRSTAHTIGGQDVYRGSDSSYIPENPYGYEGGTHMLGGNSLVKNQLPMREVILRATLNRLSKEEQEIEDGCGTGKKHEQTIQSNNNTPTTKPTDSMDIDNSQSALVPTSTLAVSVPPVKIDPVKETSNTTSPSTVSTNPPPSKQIPTCPICNKSFPFTVSNRELNKHIDECLAKMS